MKKILPIILFSILLVGCSPSNTRRQAVIDHFKTADVVAVPDSEYRFVVKDTNGTVWYVETSGSSSSTNNYDYIVINKTLMFKGE